MTRTVVVVGGGISGLAAAFDLTERASQVPGGIDVVCLEASMRPGGCIDSQRDDGFLCEWAANGFLDNAPATLELVRRLELDRRLVRSNAEAAKRFLFHAGRLRPVPSSFPAFLGSGLLSWRGRARVLTEPMRRPRRDGADESVFSFAKRRVGREAAEAFVDPLVSGVFAGDPHCLSMRATFPRLWELERKHGSLTRAFMVDAGPSGRLTSFLDGMRELTDRLALALGPALCLGSPVARISDMGVRGFRVHLGEGAPVDAGSVILACPAASAEGLVSEMNPSLARALAGIRTAPLVVVHLGFSEKHAGGSPDGFGLLVPRGEGVRSLGTLWSSSIFPSRAPDGQVLLTIMLGGARDPEVLDLTDDEVVEVTRADLSKTMGISAAPSFFRVFRQPRGIPQYNVGHLDRLAEIEAALQSHPGLYVAGNSYRGVSVNACLEEAPRIASAAVEFVKARLSAV